MKRFKLWLFVTTILATQSLLGTSALAEGGYADWYVEYFNNPHLQGYPAAIGSEIEINHHWGFNSPRQGIPADHFSARWSANIEFEQGDYTFIATVDDGVRVWVDGELIIDRWQVQAVKTYTARRFFVGGTHHVQMAYFEKTGEATAQFTWRLDPPPNAQPTSPRGYPTHPSEKDRSPYQDHYYGHPPPVPQKPQAPHRKSIIVDNTGPGFYWGGTTQYRHTVSGGYGQSFYWTYNTYTQPENFARWTPTFAQAGNYEVFVYIPSHYGTTTNLRYRVLHSGKQHDIIVNQDIHYNQWVSLGTFYFNGHNSGHEFVAAYDNTRESYATKQIAFDAVKFVAY